MNKQSYLNELQNLLKSRNVDDIEEIIAEYDVHFSRKMADGYTEDEIAAKLGGPKEIAAQFASSVKEKAEGRGAKHAFLWAGLVFGDIFVIAFFIVMTAWVFVLGLSSVTSAAVGLGLIFKPLIPVSLITLPTMPYGGALIWSITVITFGMLLAILTTYSWALTRQMWKAYRRWHKNTLSDGKYPPLAIHPMVGDVTRRKLRTVSLVALVAFGVSFIVGYIVLATSAGSLGFWHVWHWFA